jgi:hypothetical protein
MLGIKSWGSERHRALTGDGYRTDARIRPPPGRERKAGVGAVRARAGPHRRCTEILSGIAEFAAGLGNVAARRGAAVSIRWGRSSGSVWVSINTLRGVAPPTEGAAARACAVSARRASPPTDSRIWSLATALRDSRRKLSRHLRNLLNKHGSASDGECCARATIRSKTERGALFQRTGSIQTRNVSSGVDR